MLMAAFRCKSSPAWLLKTVLLPSAVVLRWLPWIPSPFKAIQLMSFCDVLKLPRVCGLQVEPHKIVIGRIRILVETQSYELVAKRTLHLRKVVWAGLVDLREQALWAGAADVVS